MYTPVGVQGGLTGALFREFAFTLAGAVIVSGVVALTLSPMMGSKLLHAGDTERGFAGLINRRFEALRATQVVLAGELNETSSGDPIRHVLASSDISHGIVAAVQDERWDADGREDVADVGQVSAPGRRPGGVFEGRRPPESGEPQRDPPTDLQGGQPREDRHATV